MERSVERAKGIQSVETAMAIFDVIAESPAAMRLSEVARQSGLAANKVHAYLVSLIRVGLVQHQADGLYAIGHKALHLGVLALGMNGLFAAVQQAASLLSDETGDAVLLTVWDQDRAVNVAQCDNGSLPVAFQIGKTTPLTTATGAVFMAYLPTARQKGFGGQPQAVQEALMLKLEQVRRDGFATAEKLEIHEGVVLTGYGAVAAPIFRRGGSLAYVLSILVASHLTSKERETHAAALLRTVRELSAGATPQGEPR